MAWLGFVAALPATAAVGDVCVLTFNNSIYECLSTNVWTYQAAKGFWGHIYGTTTDQIDMTAAISAGGGGGVPVTRTVNGHALSADVVVTKADVSLGNCDNTSDAAKPVSTAAVTAIGARLSAALNLSDLVSAATARTNLALGNIDNTSDANKPISSATQTALNAKLTAANNLSDVALAATARTNLGVAYGTSASTVCVGNDARLSDARVPSGTAAGDLAGTYPNPTVKASVALTTPNIGAATGTSLAVTGAITSSSGGIGYTAGNGGTVTQATSKATTVVLNKLCGTITMNNAALAAAATVSFTVTNSTVTATDVIHVQHDTIGAIGSYLVMPNTSAAGSFRISVRNNSAASLGEAIVLRFAVIKAVTT